MGSSPDNLIFSSLQRGGHYAHGYAPGIVAFHVYYDNSGAYTQSGFRLCNLYAMLIRGGCNYEGGYTAGISSFNICNVGTPASLYFGFILLIRGAGLTDGGIPAGLWLYHVGYAASWTHYAYGFIL